MDLELGGSRRLYDAARDFIPGGVNTGRRRIDPTLCFRRGDGAYLEDMDGNRYLDYHAAYSAVVLGHAAPAVDDRVVSALKDGVLFGAGVTELEVAVAEKIVEHVPSVERVLLCNSGSEATYHAVRLARAATGRDLILKFQGCYHGVHDYVLLNTFSRPEMIGKRDPGSSGMLDAAVDATLVCRFNDLADVDRTVSSHPEQIAAIVVEPIAHNAPSILPQPGFLEGLRAIADREGILLIFDEMITGFRHHIGGYQAICGVRPDLTALGKALANGYPLAALGGRRELMERFSTAGGDVFFAGTTNGNAVAAAAGLATIETLQEDGAYEHLFSLGQKMRDGLTEIANRLSAPAIVTGFGSIFSLVFMEGDLISFDDVVRVDSATQRAYRQDLLKHGVFELPDGVGRNNITLSHTEAHIDETLQVAEKALRRTLDDLAGAKMARA